MKSAKCKIKNKNLQSKICNLQFAIKQQGFSLVELLIAMAIAVIVGMAGYVIFSSSNWSYKVQEDVSEVQQSVRVATDRLATDIRMAGFGLPDPPFSITIGTSGALTAPIMFTNNSTGSDTITILGIGYEAGKLTGPNNSGQNNICYKNTTDTEKLSVVGGTVPLNRQFISIDGVLFVTLNTATTSAACGTDGNTLPLASPATLDRTYQAGSKVYIIQAVRYSIVDNDATSSPPCTSSNPCLRSQDFTDLRGAGSQVFAANIEDLQFAYGIDASPRDGKIDYTPPYSDAAFVFSATGATTLSDPSSIIAVKANIVGRTRNTDSRGATFKKQCLEDRSTDTTTCGTAAAPVTDGYRRRALTKIIKIRNPKQGA